MSTEATNIVNPEQPGVVVNVDPLFADLPDDDIFKVAEPSKGIDRKAVISGLPDDAKRIINDVKLGAQKAAHEALEAKKAADAARTTADQERTAAEAARKEAEANAAAWKSKLDSYKPEGDDPLAAFAANPRLAKLYGLAEGDVFDAPPEVDVDVPEVNDEALSDPAKLRELLTSVAKKAAAAGAAKAREDFIGLQRESMKPVVERAVAQKAQAAQDQARNAETEWRKAHPGMDTPEGWADFYQWSRDAHGVTEERWPYANDKAFTVGYKAYAAEKGIKVPGVNAPATQPAATPAPAAPAKAPANPVQQLLTELRRGAQDAQGGSGVGIEDGELIMPMSIRDNHAARNRWIQQTPAAKAAFESGDQEAIRRIMRQSAKR